MANNFGTLTLSTTGSGASARSFTGFGFDPNDLEFEVGAKNGNSSNMIYCTGSVDFEGTQSAQSGFVNSSAISRQSYSDRCIQVWEHDGANWNEVLKATFHSYITDGFKLNVLIASSDYQVFVRARNT